MKFYVQIFKTKKQRLNVLTFKKDYIKIQKDRFFKIKEIKITRFDTLKRS